MIRAETSKRKTAMETNLAYMNEAAERAIALEDRSEPTPSAIAQVAKQSERTAYGFTIPDSLTRELALADKRPGRLTLLNGYRDNALTLRKKLEGVGVTPLAVITTTAWNALVDKAGLFILVPDRYGCVFISHDLVRKLRGNANIRSHGWLALFPPAIILAIIGQFFEWSFEPAMLWTCAAAGLATLVAGVVAITEVESKRSKARYRRAVVNYLATHDWPQVLRDLLRGNGYGGQPVHITLPDPPIDVADILCRLPRTELTVHIAAEAGAISLKHGLKDVFDEAYDGLLAHEEALRKDPIIYVQQGMAVAIVAQFGDFPIERALIDDVLASEHLL
jgi:hypothetical protein